MWSEINQEIYSALLRWNIIIHFTDSEIHNYIKCGKIYVICIEQLSADGIKYVSLCTQSKMILISKTRCQK